MQTGLDIIQAIEDLNRDLEKDFGRRIACGVGVHCGNAVVGNIGCEYRMDYTAIGDTVNVAERLESLALGGQVLISGELYERVRDRYGASLLGEQSLKGRQDKVTAYMVDTRICP